LIFFVASHVVLASRSAFDWPIKVALCFDLDLDFEIGFPHNGGFETSLVWTRRHFLAHSASFVDFILALPLAPVRRLPDLGLANALI
jgi:hypothetical protein